MLSSAHCRTGQNKLWPTVVPLPQHRATWNSTCWSQGRSRDYQLPWDIKGLTWMLQSRVGGFGAPLEIGGGERDAPFSMEDSLKALVDPVSVHIEVGFCSWSCCYSYSYSYSCSCSCCSCSSCSCSCTCSCFCILYNVKQQIYTKSGPDTYEIK